MNICKACYYLDGNSCMKNFRSMKINNITKCNDFLGKKKGRIKDINKELRDIRKIKNEIILREDLLIEERKELNKKLKEIR